jgi:hypothetical protein
MVAEGCRASDSAFDVRLVGWNGSIKRLKRLTGDAPENVTTKDPDGNVGFLKVGLIRRRLAVQTKHESHLPHGQPVSRLKVLNERPKRIHRVAVDEPVAKGAI